MRKYSKQKELSKEDELLMKKTFERMRKRFTSREFSNDLKRNGGKHIDTKKGIIGQFILNNYHDKVERPTSQSWIKLEESTHPNNTIIMSKVRHLLVLGYSIKLNVHCSNLEITVEKEYTEDTVSITQWIPFEDEHLTDDRIAVVVSFIIGKLLRK